MLGSGADEFLGTQGDPWDTQSDMFTALLGALFARAQDRQIAALAGPARAIAEPPILEVERRAR